MYGAGELMRYAALKNDPEATPEQIEQARQSATRASEAVLLLHYIPMRTGTTQAYIRRHVNGNFPEIRKTVGFQQMHSSKAEMRRYIIHPKALQFFLTADLLIMH